MQIARTVSELETLLAEPRARGARITFVPTMGNLHAGHLRLVEAARRLGDYVVVSIYVNPLQFGPNEDFAAYPRTPEEDRRALERLGTDLLFLPGDDQVYPRGRDHQTLVEVPGLSDILCGANRPGHFRGVTTVVARLFGLVRPQVAVFGKKDYQQWLIIRRMVDDLALPVEIHGEETVREADGLAKSSRNRYLSAAERATAPQLYATLEAVRGRILQGARDYPALEAEARSRLVAAGFRPDYFSVRRQADLAPPGPADRRLVLLAAAWLGRARLIDNLEVDLNGGP